MAQRDAADLKRENDSLEQKATSSASELVKMRAQVESLEQEKQAHDLKIEILHQDFAETTLKEREEWKRKVAEADSRSQRFEDDAIERGRERDAARREIKSLESALQVERSNVAAEEKARKAAEAQSDQQHTVLASMDKIIGDLRAELSLTKKDLEMYKEQAGRTVVSARLLDPASPELTRLSHFRSSTFECRKRLFASKVFRWRIFARSARSCRRGSTSWSALAGRRPTM